MSDLTTQNPEGISQDFVSDEYELNQQIGQGGFGVVYKAVYKKTGQNVAIKFLHLAKQSDGKNRQRQIARFERESDFVSKLSHPNIVRLLDKGSINDTNVYSVFEFVDGTSLNDYIKQKGALDVEETYNIMLQVLDALVHAHQQGIIHRDIKPSNIMLSQTGAKSCVKLLDFSISTLTLGQRKDDYQMLTMTQESIGTPTYCAPEQLRGELATFSSDIYLWGLVFLECLTGEPAIFGSSTAETYHKHLSDTAVPIPSALLSHPLGHLLQQVLRKNASERISRAEELYQKLDQLVISNLVGLILPISAKKPSDNEYANSENSQATLILRKDDPNHLPTETSQLSERKQITTLALRMRIKGMENAQSDLSIIETFFYSTRSQCLDIARRYGGYHVGNLSDLSLFYFGHPVASDHDARLAARTALEIISLANKQQPYMKLRHGCELELNIGIHSGILLKRGNHVPDGFANHYATDLSYLAGDKSILCSLDTKAILEPYYQFEDAAEKTQNSQQPSSVLKAERIIEAFGFVRGVRNTSSLIGRKKELSALRAAVASFSRQSYHSSIEQAPTELDSNSAEKDKHAVHLHGEAGIGKSRLIHEFRRLESARAHQIFQCLPEHKNNALYPILSIVKTVLSTLFDKEKPQGKQLETLISTGTFVGEKTDMITILAAWLGIDDLEKHQLSTLEPSLQKSLLFEGLSYILAIVRYKQQSESAQHHPKNAIYIFEDIHWSDPTTLDFIAHLMQDYEDQQPKETNDNTQTVADLLKPAIITTSRQPVPEKLLGSRLQPVHLEQLTQDDTHEFITELFEGADVSEEVMATLATRSDGIPLFIEELVFMLKRQRLVHLNQGTIGFVDPQQIDEIPSSLRESIQHRVDGLIYAKDTLQLAASMGRQFDYERLVAASHFSELQVQNDLSELIDNQLIIQQRHVAGDRYIFKHTLVRDASYESIDPQSRPALHELIAEAIVATSDTSDRFVTSELAQHYEKAHQHAQASHWYYQAATEANLTFAVEDAIHLYESALAAHRTNTSSVYDRSLLKNILEGLAKALSRDGKHENARTYFPELIGMLQDDEDFERQAVNQIALGKTYEVVHQHDDALFHYEAAHSSLLKSPHSETPNGSSWWKIWLEIKRAVLRVYYWLGNTSKMKPILEEIESVIQIIDDKQALFQHYYDQFQFQLRSNRYSLIQQDLHIPKKSLSIAKKTNNQALIATATFMMGFSLILSKDSIKANYTLVNALELAKAQQDKVLQTRCCTYLSSSYRLTGMVLKARNSATESLNLANDTKMDDYKAVALANLSWSYFSEKKYESSATYLEESLSVWAEVSARFEYPFLWKSHLHAISLCNLDKEFSRKFSYKTPTFAKILLDKRQVPLPEPIEKLLLQLTKNENSHRKTSIIQDLTKAAKKYKYI
ncbi:protein kinase domain-containing protein [Marinomonas sp. 2405UD68-3]|uniref:protein kinase domain-containing protein n=1 Tax=Marinomonas sp. 2405UD68-3 TaxID=3391835 RepID=UPI0039C92856